MATSKNTVTFRDVYELVDDRTARIDGKVQHLSDRFDKMEAGRLTSLESKFNELKANQSIANAKIIIIWGLVILAVNLIGSFAIAFTVRRIK